jgi:hypothetical protein
VPCHELAASGLYTQPLFAAVVATASSLSPIRAVDKFLLSLMNGKRVRQAELVSQADDSVLCASMLMAFLFLMSRRSHSSVSCIAHREDECVTSLE